MNKSESISKIASALLLAQKEMGNAVKDSKNPFFKSSYADLNSVREACIPALNKHGITALQPTIFENGKPFVETLLIHESGEYISSLTEIICNKMNDAQSHGSGVTYARRYGLQSMCNIGCEDDDGNKASNVKETKPLLEKGSTQWNSAINHLLKGTVTIKQIKEKYILLEPNEIELIELTKTK